jgi:short-subunit dehydrogenase
MASDTKAALITGASAGIGAAFARLLAPEGRSLMLTARRSERLEALAEELTTRHGTRVEYVVADLADPRAPQRLADKAAALGFEIDLLVNNAGFGLSGRFAELPLERQLAMIEVNTAALTRLTGFFLPPMLARRSGGIINVASIAAYMPGPGMSVYYASKAYVLSLTEALAFETRRSGVTVTALCPGPTLTEFADAAGFVLPRRLARAAMTADKVAQAGLAGHRAGRAVVVTGVNNKIVAVASRLLPHGLTMSLMAAVQKRMDVAAGARGAGAAS